MESTRLVLDGKWQVHAVVVLPVSGSGSGLVDGPLPVPGCTWSQGIRRRQRMVAAGGTPHDLITMRRHVLLEEPVQLRRNWRLAAVELSQGAALFGVLHLVGSDVDGWERSLGKVRALAGRGATAKRDAILAGLGIQVEAGAGTAGMALAMRSRPSGGPVRIREAGGCVVVEGTEPRVSPYFLHIPWTDALLLVAHQRAVADHLTQQLTTVSLRESATAVTRAAPLVAAWDWEPVADNLRTAAVYRRLERRYGARERIAQLRGHLHDLAALWHALVARRVAVGSLCVGVAALVVAAAGLPAAQGNLGVALVSVVLLAAVVALCLGLWTGVRRITALWRCRSIRSRYRNASLSR